MDPASLLETLLAGEYGWPTSNILDHTPEIEQDQATLIDTLQDWKSKKYQEIIGEFLSHPLTKLLESMCCLNSYCVLEHAKGKSKGQNTYPPCCSTIAITACTNVGSCFAADMSISMKF